MPLSFVDNNFLDSRNVSFGGRLRPKNRGRQRQNRQEGNLIVFHRWLD